MERGRPCAKFVLKENEKDDPDDQDSSVYNSKLVRKIQPFCDYFSGVFRTMT